MTQPLTNDAMAKEQPVSTRMISRLALVRTLVAVALTIGWELASRAKPELIAGPVESAVRLVELAASGEMIAMVTITLVETLGGLAIGAGLGLVLPFLVQMSPRLTAVIAPFAQAAVGIPKLALTPILILWFGIGVTGKIVLVALMTFFMAFVATFAGIRSVGPSLIRTVAVFGAGRVEIAREVFWHAAQPFVWAALRAALPWAINAALVGEFLAAEQGIGFYIHHSYNIADMTGVYAGILLTAVLVVAADALLGAVQRRVLAWQPQRSSDYQH
ncbi:NitT/TauT family transport system permease protein [Bosea sp. OAE752]|uniref:ABC transporter permease n=1 Tax=Bosea sp. OAE752 TaxID=2663873 RepID=UPI003D1A9685